MKIVTKIDLKEEKLTESIYREYLKFEGGTYHEQFQWVVKLQSQIFFKFDIYYKYIYFRFFSYLLYLIFILYCKFPPNKIV